MARGGFALKSIKLEPGAGAAGVWVGDACVGLAVGSTGALGTLGTLRAMGALVAPEPPGALGALGMPRAPSAPRAWHLLCLMVVG